jgi:hypothetical protein
MVGEILADFGHDPLFHVRMEGPAQIGQRARRCGNDKRLDRAAAHHILQRRGDPFNKTMLFEVMAAAPMRAGAAKGRTRLVGAWLMGRRIFVGLSLANSAF